MVQRKALVLNAIDDQAFDELDATDIPALAYDAAGSAAAAQAASQPVDSDLTAIAALTTTSFGRSFLELANAGAGRTLLALGTAATAATGDFDAAGAAAAAQSAAATDATTKANAAQAAAIAASQPVDADLTAIAALAPSDDDVIQRKAGAWTNRTMAQLAADLPGGSGLSHPQVLARTLGA